MKYNQAQDAYFKVYNEGLDLDTILNDAPWIQAKDNFTIDNITKILGVDTDTIKITKNFMNDEEVEKVLILCDAMYNQKKHDISKIKEGKDVVHKYKDKIKNHSEQIFNLPLENDDDANEFNIKSGYLNGRQPNFATEIHADILGKDKEKYKKYIWSGHISNLLYLNDNYDGGELYFPHHKLKIKPERGMLVSFPGNWFNRHGILPASSMRFAINIFFKVSSFDN